MSESKSLHTPGPWATDRSHILDSDKNVLASVPYSLGDAQDHANARLIAAAPELLEALKEILAECDDLADTRGVIDAREAIAKAEGGAS